MLSYGTAGFRGKSTEVQEIIEPISLFLLVSSLNHNGDAFGIQFTASHNPSCDNGVKICEPQGDSINLELETQVEELVQLFYQYQNQTELCGMMYEWAQKHLVENYRDFKPRIIWGHDIRPNNEIFPKLLVNYAVKWSNRLQVLLPIIYENDNITTPMLHWITNNLYETDYIDEDEEEKESWHLFKDHYINDTFECWGHFMEDLKKLDLGFSYSRGRIIDVAHGVGLTLCDKIDKLVSQSNMKVLFMNESIDHDNLNYDCGADALHKTLISPVSVPIGLWDVSKYQLWRENTIQQENVCGISFDGDADRILYWIPKINPYTYQPWIEKYPVIVLDGDKILTLWAKTIHYLLNYIPEINRNDISIKLIHTAYSNGSAINFWNEQGFQHEYASTGTKNLHPKALEADIGLYFETNGHGTITISQKFFNILSNLGENPYANLLSSWVSLTNEFCGDAMRNLLLIEGALSILSITPVEWNSLFYQEYPYKNGKVYGLNKSILQVTQEDRMITSPIGLQEAIQKLTEQHGGRVIVRASGTEDLIRIYVEHQQQTIVEILYEGVHQLLHQYLA